LRAIKIPIPIGALVETYSIREITYKSDRLSAISALAKEYCSLLGDEYLCGHWKSTLAQELMWYPQQDWPLIFAPGLKLRPSWSWVSYEEKVKLPKGSNDVIDENFKITNYHVELETSTNPFGRVNSASLTGQGTLIHRYLNVGLEGRTLCASTGETEPSSTNKNPSMEAFVESENLEWCIKKSMYVALDYPNSNKKRHMGHQVRTSREWG